MNNMYSNQSSSDKLAAHFLKFTIFKNSEEIYDPVGKNYYFEIDSHCMTLSYRKETATKFKRIFGYKQVYKYSLKLSSEEKSLAPEDHPTGFKLFLENRVFILFCKSFFDFKLWVRALKSFFDKKFMVIMDHSKKTKNENLKYSSLFKNKNSLGRSNHISNILGDFLSDSMNFGSEESMMSKLRDPKQFLIYFKTISSKHANTITKKVFDNYIKGLYELNKIFKDFTTMKFVMKMKSEMDQEREDEEDILGKDDYSSARKKDNLNNSRGVPVKTSSNNQIQNNINIPNSNESNKDKQIPYHKKNHSINSNNSNSSDNSKLNNIHKRSSLSLPDNKQLPNEIKPNSKVDLSTVGNKTLPTPNHLPPPNPNHINKPNEYNLGSNDKSHYPNSFPISQSASTQSTPKNTIPFNRMSLNNSNTNSNPNSNSNHNEPFNLKQRIFEPRIIPNNQFPSNKKDIEPFRSYGFAPTDVSENELNNSRRSSDNKIPINESNLPKPRTNSRNLYDIFTDDLADFPDLKINSQKKETSPPIIEPKKTPKNEMTYTNEQIISQPIENNQQFPKKSESKKNLAPRGLEFVPYNKVPKPTELNLDKKPSFKFNEEYNRIAFTLIETPNYGNVSFIGQRFEKIEIDEWREDN